MVMEYRVMGRVNLPNGEKIPAVIVFGDSIVDPGNNNYINGTLVKCNFPPYGRDFIGGTPTGRFSNGFIPSDIVAQELGVKHIVPAYLDPTVKPQELLTGVSFASGGSGYDPDTSKAAAVLSLANQLDLFREYLQRITAIVGEQGKDEILTKSLFIVCTGSDDIANNYMTMPFKKIVSDTDSFTDSVIRLASAFFMELYKVGARRIGVLGVPTIGCLPSQRTLQGGLERKCSDEGNEAARLFNSKVSSTIDYLNTHLPGAKFVYMDTYNPLLALIQYPAQYGFEKSTEGCCGTGKIEVSILCNRLVPNTCEDASKYVFWDSYHPSQKAYQIISHFILQQSINKFF
ncbi:GDSL esterase/lipase EXL3-like [Euphorbia lathyris]|uniref:GDSL esterase/lipase EXL3-like n=1 Tax=Euphorbia lathyris TaxID=212925 RepID=UPI003313A048